MVGVYSWKPLLQHSWVPCLYVTSVYVLLSELPGAYQIASCNLTHLKTILANAYKGRYGRDKSIEIRDAARQSVGSRMPAKFLELQRIIRLIQQLDMEIGKIEMTEGLGLSRYSEKRATSSIWSVRTISRS